MQSIDSIIFDSFNENVKFGGSKWVPRALLHHDVCKKLASTYQLTGRAFNASINTMLANNTLVARHKNSIVEYALSQ